MLLIRHYKKEQIYDILRSIFHFINCNSFIVIFTMCVCRSLLVPSFKYGQYSTWILYMHPLLWFYIEGSFIILYILFVFFFKFLYQLLLPVTMMLESWYVTYGLGQDNILYLYSHNHIRCFAISRENITMFIKSFPCFG